MFFQSFHSATNQGWLSYPRYASLDGNQSSSNSSSSSKPFHKPKKPKAFHHLARDLRNITRMGNGYRPPRTHLLFAVSRNGWIFQEVQYRMQWIARLKPMAGTGINELLWVPLSLDVWERKGEVLVVAAEEEQLAELERRRLAQVERICTVADYKMKAQDRTESHKQGIDKPENTCEPDC